VRLRDAITQTSDHENSDEELSAMEKDIMLCTGYVPKRLRNKV
jgi:hypothetical protein